MDPDAFFYNGLIARMHDLFRHLYDQVYDYFLDPEVYVYLEGLDVYWEELKFNGVEKLAVRLESRLKEVLDETGNARDILYSQLFDAMKEFYITFSFPKDIQDGHLALKILHDEGVAFLESELPKDTKVVIGDAVSYIKLCECLVCGAPEPYEDFGFNESYHVFACSYCVNKVRE